MYMYVIVEQSAKKSRNSFVSINATNCMIQLCSAIKLIKSSFQKGNDEWYFCSRCSLKICVLDSLHLTFIQESLKMKKFILVILIISSLVLISEARRRRPGFKPKGGSKGGKGSKGANNGSRDCFSENTLFLQNSLPQTVTSPQDCQTICNQTRKCRVTKLLKNLWKVFAKTFFHIVLFMVF